MTNTAIDTLSHYIRANRPRMLDELSRFIRFPTVSAEPHYASDLKRCAAWLGKQMRTAGLEQVQVVPTGRHPLAYGEWLHAPGRPTVLVYGHYDVQSPGPLQEWRSRPFEPEVRGLDLYGRGASDDKGQMFAHLKAIEAYLRSAGELPVNVKCIFEGEEEIGSPGLAAFLKKHRAALAADVAVVSDIAIPSAEQPAIVESLRGVVSLEVEVRGARNDLHSGVFGGAIDNPFHVLCGMIARLHDSQGRIAIPGFYDRVQGDSAAERRYMARVGPSDARILKDAGARGGAGEEEFSFYERVAARPALNVTGMVGGYSGVGPKAIIPARASAKVEIRLVPDQDPYEIERLFRNRIAGLTPDTVRSAVRTHALANPVRIARQAFGMQQASAAYAKGFGRPPVFLRSGGTIPVVALMQEILNVQPVLMGFGLPDDHIHGPNEKIHLPQFFKGIMTCISFLDEVGKITPARPRPVPKGEPRLHSGVGLAETLFA